MRPPAPQFHRTTHKIRGEQWVMPHVPQERPPKASAATAAAGAAAGGATPSRASASQRDDMDMSQEEDDYGGTARPVQPVGNGDPLFPLLPDMELAIDPRDALIELHYTFFGHLYTLRDGTTVTLYEGGRQGKFCMYSGARLANPANFVACMHTRRLAVRACASVVSCGTCSAPFVCAP